MIVLLSGPIDTYDITSLFSFESIRAKTSLVNSFLYMQNKVLLHNKAISLWIWSSLVPFRKGGNRVEKFGEKQKKPKARKHPIVMLPSLSVLTPRREIPVRTHTHHNCSLICFSNGYDGRISDNKGQDLKLATFSTI